MDIDFDVLLYLVRLELGNLGPRHGDSGIGDDDIYMVDSLGLEFLHDIGWVLSHTSIYLDDDMSSKANLEEPGKREE